MRGTETWRDWAQWYDSCPCTSSILPGLAPARCSRLPFSRHFIVSSSLFGFCTSYHKCICSKLVGHSCSLLLNPSCWGSLWPRLLGFPWGYCAFRFVVSSFFIFIVIFSIFHPKCLPAFFRCLSNLGAYIELQTLSFI